MTKTSQRDRKPSFFLLVCLLSACSRQLLEGGELGKADAQADGPTSIPTLFAITADLKPSNPDAGVSYGPTLPAAHEFSLLIDWTNKTATTGYGGRANQVRISLTEGDASWSTQENLDLPMGLVHRDTDPLFDLPHISYQQIVIRPTRDGCMGHATGTYHTNQSDIVYIIPFEAELIGRVDQSGPLFRFFPSGRTEFHPLDVQGVAADELLPVGTSAHLVAADGTVVPLSALPIGSAVGISGYLLDQHALAFARTYQLEVLPSASDLAGNLSASLPSLTTQTGPGFFAQDGFEGPVEAFLGGQVKVIDAATQPVPSGTRAIFFPQVNSSCTDRFTARLQVAPGAKFVKLNVRLFQSDVFSGLAFWGRLRLAVPHGAITEVPNSWEPSGVELKQVELALPVGADREVIFDLNRPCSEPLQEGAGLILDDLRVE